MSSFIPSSIFSQSTCSSSSSSSPSSKLSTLSPLGNSLSSFGVVLNEILIDVYFTVSESPSSSSSSSSAQTPSSQSVNSNKGILKGKLTSSFPFFRRKLRSRRRYWAAQITSLAK